MALKLWVVALLSSAVALPLPAQDVAEQYMYPGYRPGYSGGGTMTQEREAQGQVKYCTSIASSPAATVATFTCCGAANLFCFDFQGAPPHLLSGFTHRKSWRETWKY